MTYKKYEDKRPFDVIQLISRICIELGELVRLQGQLLSLDLIATVQRSVWPMLAFVLGLMFVGISLPIFFWALVHALTELAKYPLWQSCLIVATPTFVVGLVLLIRAMKCMRASLVPLNRSLSEISKNVRWLKSTFTDFDM